MRVTDVRTLLFTAPWTGDPAWVQNEAFTDAGAFRRTSALVLVETDEGITGLGETVMGYFRAEVVPPLVDGFRDALVDRDLALDPTQPERCYDELAQRSLWWGRTGIGMSVLGAVEMALWDIAGKAAGRPVHALLGGAAFSRLPVYASGGTGSWPVERTVEQVRRYADLGFRAFKIGTGFDGRPGTLPRGIVKPPYGTWYAATTPLRVEDEVAKFGALRDAFGKDVELATDSHAVQVREHWTRKTALALAHALEPFDLLFYEEPLRYDDPEGYADLRRRTRVPIAGGECLTGLDEFRRWLELDALDDVQPDAAHCGGITVTHRVAELAEARHVGLLVHTGASVGPGLMANVHVAFASANSRAIELALAPDNIRRELLVEPLALVDGFVAPPTAPGLGVTLPPDLLERFPWQPGIIEVA
ncbi:MAG: mandelate racemase/muconate lactonizing enzyme family protein [Chloroflexota bacterium]